MKAYYVLFSFIFVLLNTHSVSAQIQQVIYQSLYVSDSTTQIEFDMPDAYQVIPWHHESKVMIELTVSLEGVSMTSLGLLIKEERYTLILSDQHPITTLRLLNLHRPNLKNGRGEPLKEIIKYRIYVPDVLLIKKNNEVKSTEPLVVKNEKR